MVFTVNYSLLSEEGRSWCCVKLSVHLLNNSNKDHHMKMRATYETNAWEKDLATKDGFTNSNVAKTCHAATGKSTESCHHVQRISAICRSYMVLEREPFSAGGNELPGGRDANTPNSEKGKTHFLHKMEKNTRISSIPPSESGLCWNSTCHLGNKAYLQMTFQFGLADLAWHYGNCAVIACAEAMPAEPWEYCV